VDAGADRGQVEVDDGGLSGPFGADAHGGSASEAAGVPEVAGEVEAEAVDEPAPREPTVLDRMQDELDDVERALERLDDGSYGTCQACGAAIDDGLLATRPTARFCPEHESAPAT
jgi:hypothetical protein